MKLEKVVEFHTYEHFGEILYVLHQNNRKYLNDSFAEYGLNLLQAMCILTIFGEGTISQTKLTEVLHLTKSGITKAIKKTLKKKDT